MNINNQENLDHQTPKWLMPLLSLLVGGGALWYVWFQYGNLMNQPQLDWYVWIRPVSMFLVGAFCLVAAVLFILDKSSAESAFMGGLSIIPLMLFLNLIVFVFRVVRNIFQGNADPFPASISASPFKVILNIIIVVTVLSVIQEIKKSKVK
jgi:hypothetical protein